MYDVMYDICIILIIHINNIYTRIYQQQEYINNNDTYIQ